MIRRKTLMVLAVVVVLALVGTSCSKKSTTPTVKKTVKIGFIGDITGSNSALVVPGKDAAALAIEQANAKGTLSKVTLEFVPLDNKEAKTTTALALAQRLIGDSQVLGIIGPAFSGETEAIQPLLSKAGLVHITQSATRASLTTHGFKTFFRAVGGDTDQAKAAADYAVKVMKCANTAVVDDKSPYGAGFADIAAATLKTLNSKVATRQSVAVATDYTSLVDTLTGKSPDCLIYGGYEPQSSILLKQMRQKGLKAKLIGGDGSKSVKFVPHAGKANAEGVIFTCPCLDANVSSDPAAKQFVADFKAKYSKAPDIYAPEAYDIVQMYIKVIGDCGDDLTRACVLNGITNLKDFKGLSKTFNWTTDATSLHEVADKGVNIYTIKEGEIVLLGNVNELAK